MSLFGAPIDWPLFFESFGPLLFVLGFFPAMAIISAVFTRRCQYCHGTGLYMREREGRCFDWKCDCCFDGVVPCWPWSKR